MNLFIDFFDGRNGPSPWVGNMLAIGNAGKYIRNTFNMFPPS